VLTVTKKELWETLRDPLVLLMSLGFPLLFFPFIIWGSFQLAELAMGIRSIQPPRVAVVGVDGPGPGGIVDALLADPAIPGTLDDTAIQEGRLDLLAVVETSGPGLSVVLHHNSTLPRSTYALSVAEEALEEVHEALEAEIIAAAGVSQDDLEVWTIELNDLSSEAMRSAGFLAQVLPLLVLVTLLTGTVMPAVDTFVGERERGTLETSLVSVRSRWTLVAGKTLAAMLIGLVSVMGTFLAGSLTLLHLLSSLGTSTLDAVHFSPIAMLLLVPTLFATAALIASMTFLVVSPAQNFKEGQTLSSYLLVGFLGLIFLGTGHEGSPETWMALVPGLNLTQCISEALRGDLSIGFAGLTTALNLSLSAVFLFVVHWVMGHEAYLFSAHQHGWWAMIRRLRLRDGTRP